MKWLKAFKWGGLSDAKIDKIAALAANPFAQPEVRMREMERLIDEGTPAAIRGVLKRFKAHASSHIADEDEKKWLEDALVKLGEVAIEPLKDYVRHEERLSYAVRALERLLGQSASAEFLLSVLQAYGPIDHRSIDAKHQIVLHLAEQAHEPRILSALLPFLCDHSDEVRCAVVDVYEYVHKQHGLTLEQKEQFAVQAQAVLGASDVSARVTKRIQEFLSRYGKSNTA